MNTLITGASSGIGEAVAVECARRGDALFLCGRNRERLEAVAAKCRAAGSPAVAARVLDVCDREAIDAWFSECEAAGPVERVFANAGVSTGVENEENVRRTFAVNVGGTVNTVLAALRIFRARKAGRRQLLVTSSIAGYGPLASCPAYAATKGCLKTWGLSLRGMLKREGIAVSVICPGFVRSRITDENTCPMPFFMEADRAAKIILRGADAGRGIIAFPWPMRFATWLLSAMPLWMNDMVNALLPPKRA